MRFKAVLCDARGSALILGLPIGVFAFLLTLLVLRRIQALDIRLRRRGLRRFEPVEDRLKPPDARRQREAIDVEIDEKLNQF